MTYRLLTSIVLAAASTFAATGPWDADVSDFPRNANEMSDSARIQRAIAAAAEGGVVWIPRGEYVIDTMIVVSNRVSLLLHKSAHLKAVREMPFVLQYWGDEMHDFGYSLDGTDHNLFIQGGDIDGAGLANCAQVMGVRHFTLANTTYRNGRAIGLKLGDAALPRTVEGGYEVVANNLYFICNRPGLSGNVGLETNIGDSHFTDIVVVDYTVGIRDLKWSNRFTRCHVWGGPVRKPGTDVSEYLVGSIAFDLQSDDPVLDDCYADTAMIGFDVHKGARIFNCGYHNNWRFKMDNPVVFMHRRGTLVVTGGRFDKHSPRATLYVREAKAKQLVWRDNQAINFAEADMQALTDELRMQNASASATKSDVKLAD